MPQLKVHQILPLESGRGSNGEWKKQQVVFESADQFARKLCVAFWNDKANEAGSLTVGEMVNVEYNPESREHNGRWYTEVKGWKLDRQQQQGYTPQPQYQQAPPQQPQQGAPIGQPIPSGGFENTADDLPF